MSIGTGNISRLVPGLIEQSGGTNITKESAPAKAGEDFNDIFSNLLQSVNELQGDSGAIQKAFLAGEPVELHQVMIKAEEAGVAMDLLLELRNKMVGAYQDLLRMPL